jgi:hypothetical protein
MCRWRGSGTSFGPNVVVQARLSRHVRGRSTLLSESSGRSPMCSPRGLGCSTTDPRHSVRLPRIPKYRWTDLLMPQIATAREQEKPTSNCTTQQVGSQQKIRDERRWSAYYQGRSRRTLRDGSSRQSRGLRNLDGILRELRSYGVCGSSVLVVPSASDHSCDRSVSVCIGYIGPFTTARLYRRDPSVQDLDSGDNSNAREDIRPEKGRIS